MPFIHFPSVTLLAAGLLGLILIALSARVVMARTSGNVLLGDGREPTGSLFVAIRSQANFAEYVPLAVVLIGLLEMRSGPTLLIKILAAILVLARVAHPVGMGIMKANPYRAAGFVGTMVVIAIASAAAIVGVLGTG